MRSYGEEASYYGEPLSGFRNLSPDFFYKTEEYFFEDETSIRPPAPIPQDIVEVVYSHPTPHEALSTHTPETIELGNDTLPMWTKRHEIAETVLENPITILTAETGAGKSTQIGQILINAGFETVHLTQPRRAAARNVYERVRDEIAEKVGAEKAAQMVGYLTAGEREGPANARIRIKTDGLELAQELHNGLVSDKEVIVVDEVHEGNNNIEGLIAVAKEAIAKNPNLRFVFLSATMDSARLASHMQDVCERSVPIIEVPGRTFAVERLHKPESTVAAETVEAATKIIEEQKELGDEHNGVLVFLPGKREIGDVIDEVRRRLPAEIRKEARIFPFHAKLSIAEQQAAIRHYKGVKIIVATDVAQTSLTIPDIKYVIDSGLHRRMELDQEGVQGLVLNQISRAEMDQRAGRAGRVSDGIHILVPLNAKTECLPYEARERFPMAEILRTDIVRTTLRFAAAGFDIAQLDLLNQPDEEFIKKAQATLRAYGAIDDKNQITKLGQRLNEFPLAVPSARMMIEVGRYSDQTRAYLSAIVAAKEVGGLPYFAYNVGKRWKDLTDETSSDMLAQLDIFIAAQTMTEKEMIEYNLDVHNVLRAQEQYRKIAKKVSAVQETLLPPTFEEREDLRHCIHAGHANSIFIHQGDGRYVNVGGSAGNDVVREISNRSLVSGHPAAVVGDKYRVEMFAEGEKITKHIIETVTTATLVELGRIAVDQGLTEWKSEGFIRRGGKYLETRRLHLFGVNLGMTEDVDVAPSPKLRERIIADALESAGPQQMKLRALKKELERLAHLTKSYVAQLTHDQLVELVTEATPADVTDATVIDNNLRILIEQRGITRDHYVSAERRERIIANAPPEIHVGDVTLKVAYRSGVPVVGHYSPHQIAELDDEVWTEDGRQVLFVHDRKQVSLIVLKGKLGLNEPAPTADVLAGILNR